LATLEPGAPRAKSRIGVGAMHIQRKRLPSGFRQAPASETCHRVVTVVSGTLHIGFGDSFDEARTTQMLPGHTWSIPAMKQFYLWAKSGDVLVQVVSSG
jgi:hypothetical protein